MEPRATAYNLARCLLWIAVFLSLALGLGALPAGAATGPVTSKVELDHPVVPAGRPATVFVLVEFTVDQAREQADRRRPPLNLALVIDRSGSMGERGKLSFAKQAAQVVVDSLSPNDRLAVVQYDDRVKVLWPSSFLRSPDMVKRRIASLSPGGSTNLTGGMMMGVKEVLPHRDSERLTRVILLSDGLANAGVTRPSSIKRLVQQAKAEGVRISSMGLGLQYNEDLMQMIAESGGGQYYYVESPRQMARIFKRELDIMFTTVGKAPVLVFTPSPVVSRVEAFGYQAVKQGGSYRLSMEDFYAGEKRSLLLKLTLSPLSEGKAGLGGLRLVYQDAKGKTSRENDTLLQVAASNSRQAVKAAANKKAQVEAALAQAEKDHEQVVKTFQKGQSAQARAGLVALEKRLAEQSKSLDDLKLKKKLEAVRMEKNRQSRAMASPAAQSRYLKASKAQIYQAKRGKRGGYLLQMGDNGFQVERLQRALKRQGLYSGPVNGSFDRDLGKAVSDFQAKKGLPVDGVAGPRTLDALGLY